MRRRIGSARLGVSLGFGSTLGLALLGAPSPIAADVVFPTCAAAGCSDPLDYASYLFIPPGGALPNDYDPSSGDAWKYAPDTGMDITGVWQRTTGRPDVVIAVLDSGIRWSQADLGRKVALNLGELPLPSGCASYDCNGDGVVSVDDFQEACNADLNHNGFCDGEDLILFYSNGKDDDGNGYVDDIAGWDFFENDNDPFDDVNYGHGTGEASDEVAEANNGSGFPGFAPSSQFLPLRVGDSFVATDGPFLQAVVYAVDRGVSVISEALGAVNSSANGQAAIDYAYARGIPIIASAADEESGHHNYPANYGHTIWVNSVRNGDGTFTDADANGYDLLNGCTNYGGKAWVAIPSASCSSEATSRTGGLTALLVSYGKNLIDRGLFTPYPGLSTPFSAEEVRQLLRLSARDVDYSNDPELVTTSEGDLLSALVSAPALGLTFGSSRYPTQPGWDEFTGYGRPEGVSLLDLVTPTTMPPEADLSGSLAWFDLVDPVRTPSVDVVGSARAARVGNQFQWVLQVGCGVQPETYTQIGSGQGNGAPVEGSVLASWDAGSTAATCGFDPSVPVTNVDDHTVTLRLQVTDLLGNVGEDRRTIAIDHDPSLHFAPRQLTGSGESSPVLVDVNRDGVLDIVHGGGDGTIHAIDGRTGLELPGFPVLTNAEPVHPSPAYTSGAVPVPHEAVIGAIAADDLDRDGHVEIVAPGIDGTLYVLDDHGRARPGFPVHTDPAFSQPANRDQLNDSTPGIVSAPALVDLDPPGTEPNLEIVFSGLDGHLYAYRANGQPVAGFPVRLADTTQVSIDPATGKATPLPGSHTRSRAAKSLSSPAVGDLDGDGRPEIVVATNEEYDSEPNSYAIESKLFSQLALVLGQANIDQFSLDTNGRVYAVHADGALHAGGPFLSGWPARVPLLTPGVLPTVGTGTPGAPAIADLDGSGQLRVAIFGVIGPVTLLTPTGQPALGTLGGKSRVLGIDFCGPPSPAGTACPAPQNGFPNVPATAGSADAPFFGALGSGAFGDITGDGLPEYVAPSGGLRKLVDVAATAQQGLLPSPDGFVVDGFADHQLSAWNPRTGAVLPAFPRLMDDMQFLESPAIADVDGDGVPDVLNGSGRYLVRAYRADGSMPDGWPKFTNGWLISSPAAGDVDGDGKIDIVSITREGKLFVWSTPAAATASAIPWAGFGRDRRHTKNASSGVANVAAATDPLAGLGWSLESIQGALAQLGGTLAPPDSTLIKGSLATFLIPQALAAIGQGDELRTSKTLAGIETGLALPGHPIAALAPLLDQFTEAVRGALQREIDASHCDPDDTACNDRVSWASFLLGVGDLSLSSNPRAAVAAWAYGIALFKG